MPHNSLSFALSVALVAGKERHKELQNLMLDSTGKANKMLRKSEGPLAPTHLSHPEMCDIRTGIVKPVPQKEKLGGHQVSVLGHNPASETAAMIEAMGKRGRPGGTKRRENYDIDNKRVNIFEKLLDPDQYTGTHKHRFDENGKGRGRVGRDADYVESSLGSHRLNIQWQWDDRIKQLVLKLPSNNNKDNRFRFSGRAAATSDRQKAYTKQFPEFKVL